MRREGVARGVTVSGRPTDLVVHARLATDPPLGEGNGFRGILNSFLPRKRLIGQMLMRDPVDRVLMCQLTYKSDWDLPGGVMRQWAHWARYRNYVLGAHPERAGDYAEVTTPITCISFTDDVVMSRTATRILLSFYRSAPRRHLRYSPEQLGAKAIGHMGPFRSRNEQIWEPLFGRFL